MRYCGILFFLLFFYTANADDKKDTIPDNISRATVDDLLKRSKQIILKYPDSARKLAAKALVLSKKIKYDHGIGTSFNNIGVSYWVQSFLPISQFYLNMSVPYLKGDSAALVKAYKDIARNYIDLKDYKKGEHYFMLGLQMAGHNPDSKAALYTELTSLYNSNGDYLHGIMNIDTAYRYSKIAGRIDLQGILYNRRAQIYIHQGHIDLAAPMIDSAIHISYLVKNRRLRIVALIDMARLYLLKNDLGTAQLWADKGNQVADSLGSGDLKVRVLKVLVQIALKKGDRQKVSVLQNTIVNLQESSSLITNQKTLELIQEYFALNSKLNDIDQTEKLIKSQHRIIALLVVSLLVVLCFLIVVFIYYRQKSQLNLQLQLQHEVLFDQKKLIENQRTDLEEVNKLKDKLLATIGHDLRTPIASLSSIVDLFAMGYISTEEVTKLMNDLAPVVKGAELTLANLMDFAGSQIKGQTVMATNVNMFLISVEMKKTFEHLLLQKNIAFHNNCSFEANVWADTNQVKVIMRNLISNAIKFTNNNGQITISSSAQDNFMVISVEDSGVGMTQAVVDKLFIANQHFSQKGTSGEKGTGLGLLLCKELVELNHGRLWVETKAGEGCTFKFSLPTQPFTS